MYLPSNIMARVVVFGSRWTLACGVDRVVKRLAGDEGLGVSALVVAVILQTGLELG